MPTAPAALCSVQAPPKPRKRTKTEAHAAAAALEVAPPAANGGGAARNGGGARPGGSAGAACAPQHALAVVAQLPTTAMRVLKVKPVGEQYYREVRVPLPSGFERLLGAVARKLMVPPTAIERLVRLPDVLVADDEDVALLAERSEIVVYLQQVA